jgi:hypothetical protein
MPTRTTAAPESIDPDRLYHPTELSPLSGLSTKQLVRMMDERRIGFVVVGAQRGRRIRGSQYLTWLNAQTVDPEA